MPNAQITLVIEKAESLVALNPGGTSNPFLIATIGAQSLTTPVQNKTVNPLYNAIFTFQDCPLPSILTLRVFNKIPYVDVEDPLGTATVTLFDRQTETISTTVQLSHGGNAALAQRSVNGCGSVTLRYTVVDQPESAAQTATSTTPTPALNRSLTGSGPATPMPVPASINIDSQSPSAMRVAISPKETSMNSTGAATTPFSAARRSGTMVASNPSVTNPAATTPNIRPVEVPSATAGAAAQQVNSNVNALAVGPARPLVAVSGMLGSAQLSQLTPPSLAPAAAPSSMSYLVPQVALAPPPSGSIVSLSPNPAGSGCVSYAVPGVRVPHEVNQELPYTAAEPLESYYANNSVTQTMSTPMPAMQAPSPSSASMLPVAATAPSATRYATLLESTNAPSSFEGVYGTSQQASASSSLYTAAARAPAVSPSQRLLVVPPNIDGTPSPFLYHGSTTSSQNGSRLPSAVQLPSSTAANPFPASAPCVPSPGSIPVAVAPRTHLLTSSTSTSLRSTPAALTPQVGVAPASLSFAAPHGGENGVSAAHRLSSSSSSAAPRRGVAPAPATAGLRSQMAGAAFPSNGVNSPARQTNKTESAASALCGIQSAQQLYADPAYLLESAATGADLEVFRTLRAVDPCLTNGFLDCLDYAGRTLLHIAAWNGQLTVVQMLLAPEPAEIMVDLRALVAEKSGNTILHAAASAGQAEVAQWLRYTHPSAGLLLLSVRNARGMTAADCAMEAGFPQVARILIAN